MLCCPWLNTDKLQSEMDDCKLHGRGNQHNDAWYDFIMSCIFAAQKSGRYEVQLAATYFDEKGCMIENLCDMGYMVVEKVVNADESSICVSWSIANIVEF